MMTTLVIGIVLGCAGCVSLASIGGLIDCWRDRRRMRTLFAERALPPATRSQLDYAARANRPDISAVSWRDDRSLN
jgi:hypothetical protein